MLGVVMIDFNSYERTVQFILDLLKSSDTPVNGIAIVDNTPGLENYSCLVKKCSDIGFVQKGFVEDERIENGCYGKLNSTTMLFAKSKQNEGFAKANNLGYQLLMRIEELEYVLFSNNDIIFPDNNVSISKLINCFDNKSDIGLVGPLVIGLDGKQQSPCRFLSIYSRWWKPALFWPFFQKTRKPEVCKVSAPEYVYRLIGAFMVVKCESFNEINMFDENTFLYGEELILSEKYKKKGLKVFCDPSVKILHEGGYTTNRNKNDHSARDRKIRRRIESDLYYYEKYLNVNSLTIRLTRCIVGIYLTKLHIKDWLKG